MPPIVSKGKEVKSKKELTEEQIAARNQRLKDAREKGQRTRARKARRKNLAKVHARKARPLVERLVTHDLAAKQSVQDSDQFAANRNATAMLIALRAVTPAGMTFTMTRRAIEAFRQMAQSQTQEFGAAALRFTHAGNRARTTKKDFDKAKDTLHFMQKFPIVSSAYYD